jgi:hypothetical protein
MNMGEAAAAMAEALEVMFLARREGSAWVSRVSR